jgi:hypothetical protein
MRIGVAVCMVFLGCTDSSQTGDGGASAGGHFTYSFDEKVFRIEARAGATPENVSAKLERFGSSTRDRWLVPSHDGAWLVLSTERVTCSLGECLAIAPRDLSSLSLIAPGGDEVSMAGVAAVTNAGTAVIFSSQDGPHEVDLWLTRKSGSTWGAATLLTGSSSYAYNNMPALTFDEQRVYFDCGREPYPESGGNDACEVRLDGSGFRVVVTPATLPDARQNYVQFPHDSLDGVLFESTWTIEGDRPETIWQLADGGSPRPIGKVFTNAVSPCGLPDGRFGVLWLSRPGNMGGAHELALAARDGSLITTLTPGVDVQDIGVGCSD